MSDKDSAGIVSLDLVIEDTAEKQIEKIAKSAVKPAQKHFSNVGKTIENAITKQTSKIHKSIEKNISSVKEPKSFKVANDAIGLMEQKLGNIGSQMGTVSEKIAKVESQYEKLGKEKGFDDDEVIKLENELTSLQAKLISLQSTANATEDKLNKALSGPVQKAQKAYQKAYDDIVNRAANASKQAEQWAIKAERAHSKSASRAAKHAVAAYNKQAKAARTYANKYADAQSDANDKSIKAVERAYKKMESTAKKAANASSNAMHKMAKDSSKSTSGMGRAFHKLGKTIKGSLKAVFVTAVLYKFFKAFKDNITGALGQNKQFAKSLNEIKANLSVAFTPIIEAIMPMITRLAQGLATITKYIATFIAAIFGKTYKQAVNSTKKMQAQAEKAKASTSRDFDELHNVDEDSGSGSDGSSINYDALDTSQLDTGPMKKFQEILDKVKDTIEKVSPAFKNLYEKGIKPVIDWLGGKVKDAFAFLGKQLEKVGNWFVDNKDRISKFGDSLGKLWGWLEPILDAAWETLKNTLGNLFDGFLVGCSTALDVASGIIDLIVSLFTGDWEGVKQAGEDIINGLWEGIKKSWENTKKYLTDLWNGIIDTVKAIFGIHSPSTVFSDIGKNIIEGLKNGIIAIWETLTSVVKEKLDKLKTTFTEKLTNAKDSAINKFAEIKDGIKEKLSGIWTDFKEFINKLLGGIENMLNKPITAINKLIDKLNSLKVKMPEILGGGEIGFNISRFSKISIPRLAKGGIVDKPTLSLIGEAGKEAVVPLQNNTEWMEKLVTMLANALVSVLAPMMMRNPTQEVQDDLEKVININVDGRTAFSILLNLFKKYASDADLRLITGG